jgi:hypothetical protein
MDDLTPRRIHDPNDVGGISSTADDRVGPDQLPVKTGRASEDLVSHSLDWGELITVPHERRSADQPVNEIRAIRQGKTLHQGDVIRNAGRQMRMDGLKADVRDHRLGLLRVHAE